MRNENRPRPAAALAEYRLLRISRIGLKWRIAEPTFPIYAPPRFLPCHSRFMPRNSRFTPRHSRFMPRHSRFMPRHSRFLPQHSQLLPYHSRFSPVIPAKAGIHSACPRENGGDCGRRWDARERGCASLSKSGFTGLAGFSGFHFARLALLGRPRARLRVFAKIRIHRIGGIFRISFRPARAFRHNCKSSQDEYGQAPAESKTRAGGILKIP